MVNLIKYPIKLWQLFWAVLLLLVVIALLAWATIGIYKAANTPPPRGIDKARDAYIKNCSGTTTNGFWDSSQLIPNTAGDDPTKWKCEVK